MRQQRRLLTILLVGIFLVSPSGSFGNTTARPKAKEFKVLSPDGKTMLKVTVGESISYEIESGGRDQHGILGPLPVGHRERLK